MVRLSEWHFATQPIHRLRCEEASMQLIAPIDTNVLDRRNMKLRVTFAGCSPPTPAEAAIASVRWERRGLLGRLVRLDP